MDGELCGEEAEALLGQIKRDPESRQDWLSYHLIGDVMRQSDYIRNDISAVFFERLQAEPTVLAPYPLRSSSAGYFAMSAAASIMAMAFLAWTSLQIDTQPLMQQAQQSAAALYAAQSSLHTNSPSINTNVAQVNDGIKEYLLAHHEFSPGTDVRGATSYIRTVAARQAVTGQ